MFIGGIKLDLEQGLWIGSLSSLILIKNDFNYSIPIGFFANFNYSIELFNDGFDQFHPEAIARQIPRLAKLLEARQQLRDLLGKLDGNDELDALLEEFNIQHIRKNLGRSLSGGERRRTEIARTLATDPSYILLDEPFAGVDPISVNDIKQIIEHLRARGIGILLTDHNVRETLDICAKAYIVSEGRIIAEGNSDTILSNSTVREVYLGANFRL